MALSLHAGPTGLLIDSAMKLVFSCIPEVSVEERREALERASDHALRRGVTTVIDMGRYFLVHRQSSLGEICQVPLRRKREFRE